MNIDVKFKIKIKDVEVELNVAEFQELKRAIEETSNQLQENHGPFPFYPHIPSFPLEPHYPFAPGIEPGTIRYGKDTITCSGKMTIEMVDGKSVIQR